MAACCCCCWLWVPSCIRNWHICSGYRSLDACSVSLSPHWLCGSTDMTPTSLHASCRLSISSVVERISAHCIMLRRYPVGCHRSNEPTWIVQPISYTTSRSRGKHMALRRERNYRECSIVDRKIMSFGPSALRVTCLYTSFSI